MQFSFSDWIRLTLTVLIFNIYSLSLNPSPIICRYSHSKRTHYDSLNLNRNCTNGEIRESFAKLSKQVNWKSVFFPLSTTSLELFVSFLIFSIIRIHVRSAVQHKIPKNFKKSWKLIRFWIKKVPGMHMMQKYRIKIIKTAITVNHLDLVNMKWWDGIELVNIINMIPIDNITTIHIGIWGKTCRFRWFPYDFIVLPLFTYHFSQR